MYKIDIKKISACISGGHNRHNSKSHENGNYCVHHPAAPIAMLDQCCHDEIKQNKFVLVLELLNSFAGLYRTAIRSLE
jgi:hypothetical protein